MKPRISSTQRLGALACSLLLVAATFGAAGCTQQQKISVAQEIVNWTPAFISTADTVNASIMALDPATIAILGPITAAVNAFGPEFQKAAQSYLANPGQTTLQVLQSLVTQIQQDTNSALLSAAKITNPASQATATRQINLLATIANTLLSLVQSISSKQQIAAMSLQGPTVGAIRSHIALAQVRSLLDEHSLEVARLEVQRDTRIARAPSVSDWFALEAQAGF